MIESWILCKYSESPQGQVELVKVDEFSSRKAAINRALELYGEEPSTRFVLLTALEVPTDSRA